MKHIYSLIIFAAGVFTLASCNNDKLFVQNNEVNSDEVIAELEVTADDFIPFTRTTISNTLAFAWAANDAIGVFPQKSQDDPTPASQVQFSTLTGGEVTSRFYGSGWGLMPERKYYAYFPYTASAADSIVTITFKTSVSQSSNNATTNLGANDVMYSSATPEPGNLANFQFHHLTGIMKFEIEVPNDAASIKFSKVIISCAEPVFMAKSSFVPTTDAPVLKAETLTDKLTVTTGFAPVEGKLSIWLMTGPVDLTGKTLTVTVYDTDDKYTGTVDGAELAAGKAHLYEVAVTKAARDYSDPSYMVDLGLPSGKKWAVSNLTVNGLSLNSTVFGDYYAWGELTPYYTSLTVIGEENVNVVWKSGYEGGYTQANYNKNTALSGYTSSSAKLSKDHDAAYQLLGEGWSIPTVADLDELEANCNVSAATINGVDGVKYASKHNSNFIFMPVNGYFNGTTFKGYTASSPANRFWMQDNSSSTQAYQQYGSKSSPGTHAYGAKDKWRGAAIRPVYTPAE